MGQLKLRIISGIQWSLVSRIVTVSTTLFLTILLARLLSPRDFGLIGMIGVFTGFFAFFVDMGFGQAVIQKQECSRGQIDAAFWANIILGGLITVLLMLLAPVISAFYREPRLAPLVTVLAFNYLFTSVYVIRNALLRKEMKFQVLARIEIVSAVASASCALAMALAGFGVWSLVGQYLALSLVPVFIGWNALAWKPSWSFSLRPLRGLLSFSANLFGSNTVNYWMRNADNMLIGRYIGAAALGLYSRAYTLMLLPLTQITVTMGRVMVPALSSIQNDRARVKAICLRAVGNIALITFPLMLGMFALADHFVLALLGPGWEGVIPVLRILCFVGLDHSISATTDWIYQSQGRTSVMFRWSALATTVYIASFIAGLRWGITGVAWGYLLSNYVLLWYPAWRIAGSLIGIRPKEVVAAVAPALAASLVMLLPVYLVTALFPAGAPHALILAAGTLAGAGAYAGAIRLLRPETFGELRAMIRRQDGGRPAGPALPTVIHYTSGTFLPLTENWIYSQIAPVSKFFPVVYCHGTENLDAYPVPKIRAAGGRAYFFPAAFLDRFGGRLLGFSPYFAWHLYRDRPSLIHAHFGPSGYAFLRLKKLLRVPLITTFYGYDLSKLPAEEPAWKERYGELFAGGDCFLVEGGHMRQCLIGLGCPGEKVIVQHLGVDVGAIPFRPRVPDASGETRILIAGTFKEKKGIPYGIEAFAAVSRKHPSLRLRLTVIGDARRRPDEEREKARIRETIERLGVGGRIAFPGFQPNEVFRRQLYRHHIFLAPSVTASDGDTEGGSPVSIIEASASGMPVLATTHCDIPETVIDGESGYLVPERDAASLAGKLETLVLSPELREKMGRRGRRHVEKNYESAAQARRLEEIFERIGRKQEEI